MRPAKTKKVVLLFIGSILWLALVEGGFAILYNYALTPGKMDIVAADWPAETIVERGDKEYQLVMVVHPHCPCTRASLSELELLIAQTNRKLDIHMLFHKAKQYTEEWTNTDLLKKARNIPDIRIVIDEDGQQARLFGGTTSGQTFLFNKQGKLIFSGGITASRGHSGDNAGRSAIVSLVKKGHADLNQTPFFGCPLQDHRSQKDDEA